MYGVLIVCIIVCACAGKHKNALYTKPETHWSVQFDFDGDGNNDRIVYRFTGGAHCCYLISVLLSSDQTLREYPFEMDGGYEGGLDLGNPSRFDIKDFDGDGLPEIFMEINTYNDEIYEIPLEWTKEYGITSNYIVIDYKDAKLIVVDYQ
jgi:hypothetical protein